MLQNRWRFVIMIITGLFIGLLMKNSVYAVINDHPPLWDYLLTIVITCLVWEGNLRIDRYMNRLYPWVSATRRRLLTHFPIAFLYSFLVIYGISVIYGVWICGRDEQHQQLMWISLIIGLVISFMLLGFEIANQLLKGWKQSILEVEQYKTESARAQLQNLKDQVNPHFLFNNLSVLSSLVYADQDKAVDFIRQMANVYRYILDNQFAELVSLEQELKFLESYLYLLKIRFGKAISVEWNIAPDKKQLLLPPMVLQLLVENVVKHNEMSIAHPLTLIIRTIDNELLVCNSLNPRPVTEESTGTGHTNIRNRYRLFTDRLVHIGVRESNYCVSLPLLSLS